MADVLEFRRDRGVKEYRAVRFCTKCGSRAFRITQYAADVNGDDWELAVECYNCEDSIDMPDLPKV